MQRSSKGWAIKTANMANNKSECEKKKKANTLKDRAKGSEMPVPATSTDAAIAEETNKNTSSTWVKKFTFSAGGTCVRAPRQWI